MEESSDVRYTRRGVEPKVRKFLWIIYADKNGEGKQLEPCQVSDKNIPKGRRNEIY
jgi:hypothetical protein